jgi:hypothetical protein
VPGVSSTSRLGNMSIQKDKLNEGQKKEIERLRNFVSRNRLNAQMNGTKWRLAIDAIQAIPGYKASFRVKRITDSTDPVLDQWDENFPAGIPLYNSIEWLELNPYPTSIPKGVVKSKQENYGTKLKLALETAQIPIQSSPTGIRIIGYTRPGG